MEDPSVFFSEDFCQTATFEKKDGSFQFSCLALYEDGTTAHDSGDVSMETKSPQVSIPLAFRQNMIPGDIVKTGGRQYRILDFYNDGLVAVFPLSPLSGTARQPVTL